MIAALVGQGAVASELVAVEAGTVEFHSSTNVSGVDVKGASKALSGRAEVLRAEGGVPKIGLVEVSVPVVSLLTGMKMRDEHMRKYIFTTASGEQPDMRFTADTSSCSALASGREFACTVQGSLAVRGVAKPFGLKLKVREQGASFRVSGDGWVKLSAYGIDAPVQLGVRVSDDVAIRVDFATKTAAAVSASKGGGQ